MRMTRHSTQNIRSPRELTMKKKTKQKIVRLNPTSVMTGTKVKYAKDVIGGCSSAVETVVRCLLLLWTGDYPAQCEVGKFINCGIFPCRRHYLRGTNICNRSTYYIANNRVALDFLSNLVFWLMRYLVCCKLKRRIAQLFDLH